MKRALLTILLACTGCEDIDGALSKLFEQQGAPRKQVTDNTTELVRYVNELETRVKKLESLDSWAWGAEKNVERDTIWDEGTNRDPYWRHHLRDRD